MLLENVEYPDMYAVEDSESAKDDEALVAAHD